MFNNIVLEQYLSYDDIPIVHISSSGSTSSFQTE